MNKKSSLKKKSSLLPFLALPAAGALAGGAYYWQQNNGEDAGLSKQEKAKRLLRCLILGGATGLGAATAYTGGKMTYDNLIKDSSYKKKVTKNTLLKQLVKKSSKKRNLLKLLVKQAAGAEGINTNYLIGGGLGLLGGLGLYHFLNNEEAKKKGLGGYIGAGLTGLGAGLLGAGAYNQTQYGALTDQFPGWKRIPAGSKKLPAGWTPETVTEGGVKYNLVNPDTGNIKATKNSDPTAVVGSTGGDDTPSKYTGITGSVLGDVAVGATAAPVVTGAAVGATQAMNEAKLRKSPSFQDVLLASDRASARATRPYFQHGKPQWEDIFWRPEAKMFTGPRNATESVVSRLLGNKPLSKDVYDLYDSLKGFAEANAFSEIGGNARANQYLVDHYGRSAEATRARQLLENNSHGSGGDYNPLKRDIGATFDPKTGVMTDPGTRRFISADNIKFGDDALKQSLSSAHNRLQFWKAVYEQTSDPIVKEQVAQAEANYKNVLDGKVSYGDIDPATYGTASDIKNWKYYTEADPAKMSDIGKRWANKSRATSAEVRALLQDMVGQKQFLPDDLRTLLSDDYVKTFNEVPELTPDAGKNLEKSNYKNWRSDQLKKVQDAQAKFEEAVRKGSLDQTALRDELVKEYRKLEAINARYSDIKGGFTVDPMGGPGVRMPDTVREVMYKDPSLEGLSSPEIDALHKEHDFVYRGGSQDEWKKYRQAKEKALMDNLTKRIQELKAKTPGLTDVQAAEAIAYRNEGLLSGEKAVPKAIKDMAKKQVPLGSRIQNNPLWQYTLGRFKGKPAPTPSTPRVLADINADIETILAENIALKPQILAAKDPTVRQNLLKKLKDNLSKLEPLRQERKALTGFNPEDWSQLSKSEAQLIESSRIASIPRMIEGNVELKKLSPGTKTNVKLIAEKLIKGEKIEGSLAKEKAILEKNKSIKAWFKKLIPKKVPKGFGL